MDYRLFFMDSDQHITGVHEEHFESDEAALHHASSYLNTHPAVAIWSLARFVGVVGGPQVESVNRIV
jgi:hypothetical protein